MTVSTTFWRLGRLPDDDFAGVDSGGWLVSLAAALRFLADGGGGTGWVGAVADAPAEAAGKSEELAALDAALVILLFEGGMSTSTMCVLVCGGPADSLNRLTQVVGKKRWVL